MTRLFLILVFGIPWLLLPQPMARAESLEYVFGAASGTVKGFDFAALENSSSKKVIRGGGLQINHVGQKVPLPSVGGKTRFGLRGDFEIELSFLVEELGIPTSGDGSGIMLRLEYADKEQSGLTLALNASPNELLFWQIDNTTNGQQNHQRLRVTSNDSSETIRRTDYGDCRCSGNKHGIQLTSLYECRCFERRNVDQYGWCFGRHGC